MGRREVGWWWEGMQTDFDERLARGEYLVSVLILLFLVTIKTFIKGIHYGIIMKLKLNGWELGITFSACHFLPGHSKCNRLHGHNYAIHLEIEGEPGKDGIVCDFVVLKAAMKAIASTLDHCVLLPKNSKGVEVESKGKNINALCGIKTYSFPKEDVTLLDIEVISAEFLAKYVLDSLLRSVEFKKNVHKISVGIDEGLGQGAWAWKEL